MKIAKKVLAVVMAVAMIAALSAMAFAADGDTKLELKPGEVKDGVITVELVAKNAEGLKTVDATIKYPSDVLSVKGKVLNGPFVGAYDKIGESVSAAHNPAFSANEIKCGVAIAESILSNDAYKTAVADNDVADAVELDTAELVICTVKFTVKDGATADSVKFELTDNTTKTVVDTKEVALKTAPVETQPVVVATTEAATKASNPPTGDKTTGDNMALAAAAGVVVLAGAAFIISKKRK